MKAMFDTNIYISFIRNRTHHDILLQRGTVKYMSAVVLMELWAGSKTRKADRLLHQLQRPYAKAGRIITLRAGHYIAAGHLLSDLKPEHKKLAKQADFINDIQIALTALHVGATLYTENKKHFRVIAEMVNGLKVEYRNRSILDS
ncbi:MAG: type II toxin-antitoxin system VapC family toxin [Deltaproteobacteria bacterium]|nr:type II toxin-antitoxin system VapC family toxin [Deltaproteobacteria bacterium]